MRLAVMQPYIFPYLGYFQLVNAVDKFIFFDDVNYINRGWINRNQLLQQNQPYLFTVPLVKASQNRKINEIEISDFPKWRKDFLKQIEFAYKKAPYFEIVFHRIVEFLSSKDFALISDLASGSVKFVSDLVELGTEFEFTSALDYMDDDIKTGQDKILKICEMMHADTYINPKNGTDLYDSDNFTKKSIQLHFIWMDEILYPQFKTGTFVPHLSIIDVLMFNGIGKTRELLQKFTLN